MEGSEYGSRQLEQWLRLKCFSLGSTLMDRIYTMSANAYCY